MNTVKPLMMSGRKSISTKVEPDIIELLDKQIIKDSNEAYDNNRLKHAQLAWDRSSYIRRVLIKHLDIKLEDF